MARASKPTGQDLRARAFSWYWKSLSRRIGDASRFHRLVSARRAELDEFAHRAEARIAQGRLSPGHGDKAIWRQRPDCLSVPLEQGAFIDPPSGLSLGEELAVFHDDTGGAFTVSQRPNRSAEPRNRFEVFFESYEFEGSYLSFALAVPHMPRVPQTSEQLRLDIDLVASRPMKGFVRLNLQSSNATDILYSEGTLGQGVMQFDFDLSFAAFALKEDDKIWVDIILDRPRMMEFDLRDVSLALISKDRL
ncbi:MAG: DUF6478 family protein [Pseudomonadota bacterium]